LNVPPNPLDLIGGRYDPGRSLCPRDAFIHLRRIGGKN
jgi:hypothetical protein